MNTHIAELSSGDNNGAARQLLLDTIDSDTDAQTRFLQKLIQTPTDTPPGNNTPHAHLTRSLLEALGWTVESFEVPAGLVAEQGMQSITNLIVRRHYGVAGKDNATQSARHHGPVIALQAHGDVVPPGDGWRFAPYGAEIHDGYLYGRAAAVSKSDFATYTYALLALEKSGLADKLQGTVELHLTYDEEFGGLLGPGWLLSQGHTHPDMVICPGFSYSVVNAHNACLQFAVTVYGQAAHGSAPHEGHDALQAAVAILNALYAEIPKLNAIRSAIPGITSPTLVVGRIDGGTNTNVVPGKVEIKFDRRLIPEENLVEVEQKLRVLIADAVAGLPGIHIDIKRLLAANALRPSPESLPLANTLARHASHIFGADIPIIGTPLYTDARLYGEFDIPVVLYGAGPQTILESGAKRADERLKLSDLKGATAVIALTLLDLLTSKAE